VQDDLRHARGRWRRISPHLTLQEILLESQQAVIQLVNLTQADPGLARKVLIEPWSLGLDMLAVVAVE